MAFRPVSLPLGVGLRQDIASSGLEMPEGLLTCSNVVFTKRGAIRGRPGTRVQSGGNVNTGGSFASAVLGRTMAGLVSVSEPGLDLVNNPVSEVPLVSYQGSQYVRNDASVWQSVGSVSHVRLYRSPALASTVPSTSSRQNPAPCGTSITGVYTGIGGRSGIPFVSAEGAIRFTGQATLGNYDAASLANQTTAGNALFYMTTTGAVRAQVPGTLPASTDVLLAAAASGRTDTTARQNISACSATNGEYFVAYVSATAGRITLLRVNTVGAVVATLNVNGLGTVLGCALVADSSNRLVLAWIDTFGPSLKTKAFTTTASTITDAAIDVTFATAPDTNAQYFGFALGTAINTGTTTASVTYTTSTGSCYVGGRAFASTSIYTTPITLYGEYTGFGTGELWEPLFGAQVIGGRVFLGFQRSVGLLLRRSQWFVLDLTDFYDSGADTGRHVVAYGSSEGCDRIAITTAGQPNGNTIAFCVPEGTLFDSGGATQTVIRRITMSLTQVAGATTQGITYLTNAQAQFYDGMRVSAAAFPETYPFINDNTAASAGGSLLGGSYTYQATWELVNGRGQVERSGQSNVKTVTGVVAGQSVVVRISVPQLANLMTTRNMVRVRLWATERNPSAGAALYFVNSTNLSGAPTAASIPITHATEVDTAGDQLYTGGGVLDDEPPPAGDRGVTHAIDRVWVADQQKVYASKLLNPAFAPAFNTEGLHTFAVPDHLGQIQGLAGYDDKLVIVCSEGVAVLRGAGYDDLGNGPGWDLEVLPGPGAGVSHPRSVLGTPDGVVFRGRDSGVYLFDGRASTRISIPAMGQQAQIGDVSYCKATPTPTGGDALDTSRLFVGEPGELLMYDLDHGQWGTWSLAGTYHTSINGVLWVQDTTAVRSVDGVTGYDLDGTTPFSAVIATHPVAPADVPQGFGRLRFVRLHAPPPAADVSINVVVQADNADNIVSATATLPSAAATGSWPRRQSPEFWATVQRCRFIRITLTMTPAIAEINSLELYVSGNSATAPNSNRS